jgi:hypothetical protein
MSARRHHTVLAGQRHLVRVFPVSGLSSVGCKLTVERGALWVRFLFLPVRSSQDSNMFRKPVTDGVGRPRYSLPDARMKRCLAWSRAATLEQGSY